MSEEGAPHQKRVRCKTCHHPERQRIELELAAGRSLHAVGKEFGLSKDSVMRHWNGHVSAKRRAELIGGPVALRNLAKKAAEADVSLLDHYQILRNELFGMFQKAREESSPQTAGVVAAQLLRVLDSIGRLTGQIRSAGISITNVNNVSGGNTAVVLNSPEVIRLQSAVIRALAPFPEARTAVIEALRDLDGPRALPAPAAPEADCESPVIDAEFAEAAE